jgi:hypothetical protein
MRGAREANERHSQSFRDNGTGSVGLHITTRRSRAPEVRSGENPGAAYKTIVCTGIRAMHERKKIVAAVCHAPWLLIESGLAKG